MRNFNPYQLIAERLNIDHAIAAASTPNDLLPPRREDEIGGELGKRFSAYLARELESGRYDPVPAHIIAVPKSQLATRPAALISFLDRVVYQAIVEAIRPRIARFLLGEGVVLWPRGDDSREQWSTFERSVLRHDSKYIVSCDIAGFYESIEHDHLASAIIKATGYRNVTDALIHMLGRLMGGSRGLPQGLAPSDTLATVSLTELDRSMIRNGFRYTRHGDDVRIAADSYDHGYSAIRRIEAELRTCGLLLNSAKTRVFRRNTYKESLLSHQKKWDKTKATFIKDTLTVLPDDEGALGSALEIFELEELGWALFYHGIVEVAEVIENLRAKMTSEDTKIAAMLFASLVEGQSNGGTGQNDRLERDVFHWQLDNALYLLTAVGSDAALPSVGELMRKYPDKTQILCEYMMKLQGSEKSIVGQIEDGLGDYTMEWGIAWIARVLSRMPEHISHSLVSRLTEIVENPRDRWFAASEAAKCLASIGVLRRESLLLLWNTCPQVFRVDLAVAAVRMREYADWAMSFVASAQGDRVHEVVIQREMQRPI